MRQKGRNKNTNGEPETQKIILQALKPNQEIPNICQAGFPKSSGLVTPFYLHFLRFGWNVYNNYSTPALPSYDGRAGGRYYNSLFSFTGPQLERNSVPAVVINRLYPNPLPTPEPNLTEAML